MAKDIYKAEWKSEQAEAKYREKEAVLWGRANHPPESLDVPTQFGSTRVYRWPGNGTPVVFVHGMTDTSVRWIPYAEALQHRDVYAIDIMGDVGGSKPDPGLRNTDDYVTWFGETLDALGIERPHLVGYSLGGYLAFSYATTPDSVRSLTGLDPTGVVKLKLHRLVSWSVAVAMASLMPATIRRRLAGPLRQPLLTDKDSLAVMAQAQRGHPIEFPPFPDLTNEQLGSITAPVRVLVGAESKVFDVDRLVDRINNDTVNGKAKLLPGAGHALGMSHFEHCLAHIKAAIAEVEAPSNA